MYPVVFFDALRVKIRDETTVRSKAVYVALGVLPDGTRDILGLWIEQTEGAQFWMKVFTDLRTRGCQDILIAVTDGLKGMPEALAAVFPQTVLQTCIVHLIRRSLEFASWKERKPLASALRPIYTAPSAAAATPRWRRLRRARSGRASPLHDGHGSVAARLAAGHSVLCVPAGGPPHPLHHQRARERARAAAEDHQDPGHFPHDDAATKLLWLALRNITARWTLPVRQWKAAMHQFAILYEDRFLREDA